MRRLKLEYYCFMYWIYKLLKNKGKMGTYWAKIFVLAADMKIIGNRNGSYSEYDL